jgi:pilus assembly protein CpaF
MERRARTISVYSPSGGVGRTTIAVNLATALLQYDTKRVLLLECGSPVPGDAPMLLGLERAKSLGDMVLLLGQMSPEIFATYLVRASCGVTVLPLVNDVLQARVVTPEALRRALDLASASFDAIVIDHQAGIGPLSQTLVDRTDYVCLIVAPTMAGAVRARHGLDYLRTLQMPNDAILVCVNRAPEQGQGGVESGRLERLLGTRIALELPDDPEVVAAAAQRGVPLMLSASRHAIARGIDRLAREIQRRDLRDLQAAGTAENPIAGQEADRVLSEIKQKIHKRLVTEIDLEKSDLGYLRDPVKLQQVRAKAEAKIVALMDEEGAHLKDRALRRRVVKDVLDEALGLGPLEDLLADPAVTEIMVNRHDQIYVEKAGKLTRTTVSFASADQLRGVIERIVAPIGRRVDEKVPMADARLRDGSRVNVIIPPLALRGASLTIRKFSKKMLGVSDLVRFGTLSEQMATMLSAAVKARVNVVISGGTGSGKTTLLNTLAGFIPTDERIVTIEDAVELQLPQDHVVTLEARPPNIEGEGAITIRDLVKNALRMRPDRIVVGECRGGEALDMLQAMNTGHDGSLTTVHANTPKDALSRLETMSLMAGLDLPSRAIRDQIGSAIDLVVQQARQLDGSRRITHISEVQPLPDGEFRVQDVFVFKQLGVGPDGKVLGQFVPTGHVPEFVETLPRFGIKLPREIFLHQTA